MPIDAKRALSMLGELEEWLSAKHAEELMEGGEEEMEAGMADMPHAEPDGDEGPGGGAVVIAMKPKGAGGRSGAVPGCEDCVKGIPHEHMGR